MPLTVHVSWVVEHFPKAAGSSTATSHGNGLFTGVVGPVSQNLTTAYQNPIDITVTASDGRKTTTSTFTAAVTLINCVRG